MAEIESRGFRGSRTPLIPQASAGSRSACDCRAAHLWRTTSRRATRSSLSAASSSSSEAVLECLAANESTYKFKPSVALKRHQSLNDLDVQDDDVAIADDTEQVPAKAEPAENAVAVAVN